MVLPSPPITNISKHTLQLVLGIGIVPRILFWQGTVRSISNGSGWARVTSPVLTRSLPLKAKRYWYQRGESCGQHVKAALCELSLLTAEC
jgi:hypothetical protein